MQTFLPLPSFVDSAAVLDNRRLGKQRVEVLQILRTLRDGGAWQNHPAVLMWKGFERSLVDYGLFICYEWTHSRGFMDSCTLKISELREYFPAAHGLPFWLGNPAFHASHRSNLLRKNPEHYGQFGWAEPPDLPYVWPVQKAVSS